MCYKGWPGCSNGSHVEGGIDLESLYLKGSGPFINRSGSPNYGTITLQLGLSHMISGAPG
jgi:hypothetical protein